MEDLGTLAMVASGESLLEAGAYTVSQLAALAEISNPAKVRRWLFGAKNGAPAIVPYYGADDELVSFFDLVQIMAIRNIRSKRLVSLGKIRETIDTARKRGIEHPFAWKHRAYVFADDVVLRLDDGTVIQATGKYKEDQLIEQVAAHPLDDLGFDAKGLAESYTPMRDRNRSIVLDPRRRFGAPVVLPCNYTVETLVCAVQAEGTSLKAARALGVDLADITLALRYEDRISRAAA